MFFTFYQIIINCTFLFFHRFFFVVHSLKISPSQKKNPKD